MMGGDRDGGQDAVLGQPLTLPCGATLPNRIVKAALSEDLADPFNHASTALQRLYQRWAEGGAGLLITGAVQIDRRGLEAIGNVVIENDAGADALREWAEAGTSGGSHLWMQLNHAGRQTPRTANPHPVAPSAVPLDLPGGRFAPPRALTAGEIDDIVDRFARAAGIARDTGFTGVQIHAAHGYLLSQFLSPLTNRRQDEWGGSPVKRARLLRAVVRAVRRVVGADFPVSVKLNAADFQRGGFTLDECCQVAAWLEEDGVDLLEISGGSYERPAMVGAEGPGRDEGRSAGKFMPRNAYFVEYADAVRRATTTPLMLTGGFRTRVAMIDVIASGMVDLVGLGRPLCVEPALPKQLLAATVDILPTRERTLGLGPGIFGPSSPLRLLRTVNGLIGRIWFNTQIVCMGQGQDPDPSMSTYGALLRFGVHDAYVARARTEALAQG